MIRNLVKGLRIFKRNKVPREIKILGIAIYFQTLLQEKVKILSEFHKVLYNAVRRWIKKIEERLHIAMEKEHRNLIALDETVVKANKKCYMFIQP